MRSRSRFAAAFSCHARRAVALGLFLAAWAAGADPLDPGQARAKMDSLRRHLEKTLFPEREEKAWRQCVRSKREFLDSARKKDPAFATVDSLLRRAKTARQNPGDPEVIALLERKFALEKGLEDAYGATSPGRRCLEVENRRRKSLDQALDADPEYRRWRKAADPGRGPGPI